MTEGVRLAKRVAELKGCSRREAEQYIEGGWVKVDGQLVEVPAFRVARQAIAIDPGATLMTGGPVTVLLHKPAGYEAGLGDAGDGNGPRGSRSRGAPPALQPLTPGAHAANDTSGIRVLKKHFDGLTPLAPLPTEATGLAVFTQDWRVERKLTTDADGVEQEVMAEVGGEVTPGQLQRLGHGLSFNDRPLPPIKVSVSSSSGTATRLRFALKGIRPGQIPHMCESVGLRLLSLKRIRIGRVPLGQLAPGQWRYLLPQERF